MYPTDLTVSAVIRHEGRYLLVEERAMGNLVLTQPGGHIESAETLEQAVARETLEETGCTIECEDMIGVYLWIHPQTRQQFLRIVFAAEFIACDESLPLDDGVLGRRWMTRADIEQARLRLRSPVVLRCIHDFEAGKRQSDSLMAGMMALENNVADVIARADLV